MFVYLIDNMQGIVLQFSGRHVGVPSEKHQHVGSIFGL